MPNEPLQGLLSLKALPQVIAGGVGGEGKFVSRFTIHVTVMGQGLRERGC